VNSFARGHVENLLSGYCRIEHLAKIIILSSRMAAAVRKHLLLEETPRITMNEIVIRGRIFFAIAIVALGVQHLLCGWFRLFDGRNFLGETPFDGTPWVPAYPWLAYLTGVVLLIAGFCLIANIRPRTMATLLGILFLFFVIVLEASRLVRLGARTAFFETLAICGSALMLAEMSEPKNLHEPNPAVDWLIKSGPFLLAFSSIMFGVDHLLYLRFVASLVPSWISWHLFWA
jgi:uncharacterized membrane protein YphA (DoxX/SURF4 family)